MNTAQLHGQRLRPAQETGNEKAEPLLSIQQTPIDYPMDVIIDSSGLVMDNRNSPVGFIEEIFTRLTQRLVFEFLGGHARMQELPCLGDLADGNDEFHRITPSPTFSKSSQFKLLDLTGNLHFSSIVFMDSDVNPRIEDYLCESVLLDSFDASSTTFISSLEHFRSKLISQSADHANEESQCSPINHLIIAKTIAEMMAESLCDSDFSGTQVFMKSDGFSNGIDLMSAPIPISSNQSDKEYFESSVSKMAYPKDGSNIFDIVKAMASEIHNSSVNASIIHSTSNGDSVSSMDCMHLENSCSDEFGDSNKLAAISTDECLPKFSIPDPKHLKEFLHGNLKFPMLLASELQNEKLATTDYPSLHKDSDPVDDRYVADLSDNKFNNQFSDGVCEYDKKTSDTSGVLIGLENGSTSGEYKEMEISDPCNTELLVTNWPTADLSSFDVSGHEELLESYGLNNLGQYTDVDYTCASPTWPEKVDAAWTEGNQMNLTDLASNEDSTGCFYDENSKSSVSSIHFEQRKCALNTSTHVDSSEDYLSQGHPCSAGFENSIEVSVTGTYENPLVYAIPDPDTLNEYLYGTLESPLFLASERMDANVDRNERPPFYGACFSDDCADVANLSDECNVELLDSDSSSKDPSTLPFEFNDHYELLEVYGLNIQDQYTDTGYTCPSPTWPGKMITVSKGQFQKPLTCSIPNLTKDHNADGALTADSSLSHSNTDETSVMNKNRTDEIYERNSENSVSPCYLNRMEPALNTDDAGSMDCVPLLDSCSDSIEDTIEHQSLKNDFKFAFPDPSTLKDFFFGSLNSPKFLASGLLDGKIDNLHYPSLFGGCELDHRAENADLSDRMIFDQCVYDVSSINKFSCSIQLFDLISSPFDISDHDELLEWYGINDQDQFKGDDWTCDSPTWPGKI